MSRFFGTRGTLLVAPSRVISEDVKHRREEAETKRVARIHQQMAKDALEEKRFLEYVVLNPGTSSRTAHRALGMTSDTKRGSIRDVLKEEGLILVIRVAGAGARSKDGRVRATQLFITSEGKAYLKELHEKTP